MPLTSHPRSAELFGTYVGFPIRHGDEVIPVHVTIEALQQLDPANWSTPLAQCGAYRSRLEQIARIKFDKGLIDDGRVRIGIDDLYLDLAGC